MGGVVGEVKTGSLDASLSDSETAVYAPAAQFAFNGTSLMVRTAVPPESLAQAVVGVVRTIDPEQPVLDLFTMPRPLVVAVNGHAIAGGCIFALTGDYRLMAAGNGRIGNRLRAS